MTAGREPAAPGRAGHDRPWRALERRVEAIERVAVPPGPSIGASQPEQVAGRRRPPVDRWRPRWRSAWAISRASERTSSWLWRTTSAIGSTGPPRSISR